MNIDEIKEELKKIDTSLNDIIAKLEDENNEEDTETLEEESRSLLDKKDKLSAELKKLEEREERKNMAKNINDGLNVATNVTPVANNGEVRNYNETLEYRQAFKDYVLKGVEMRADAVTKTTDIGAVIPTSIMNKVYEKIETLGKVYAKITKTAFKGGLAVPTSSLKPTATWVAEGTGSEKQKKTFGSVTFAYYKLQCKVAVTLEADTVSLEIFEDTLAKNIAEAMVKAIELAVFQGTGSGQPKGVCVEVTATQINAVDYATLVGIEGNVPEAYDSSAEYYMTKSDFYTKIIGMVDNAKQPIARVNVGIDGKPAPALFGRNVNFVPSEYLNGNLLVVGDLSDYILNSNLQITMKKYVDEDTDDTIHKATMLADGKLASKDSFQVIKVKSA